MEIHKCKTKATPTCSFNERQKTWAGTKTLSFTRASLIQRTHKDEGTALQPVPAPLWFKDESNWNDYKSNSRRQKNTMWVMLSHVCHLLPYNAIKKYHCQQYGHKSTSRDVHAVNINDKYLLPCIISIIWQRNVIYLEDVFGGWCCMWGSMAWSRWCVSNISVETAEGAPLGNSAGHKYTFFLGEIRLLFFSFQRVWHISLCMQTTVDIPFHD